jgi:lipopolysaccharide transport system ATP-binding protein
MSSVLVTRRCLLAAGSAAVATGVSGHLVPARAQGLAPTLSNIAFQKKCLGKMGEVARDGRTVLFVSHNLAAIEALTSQCIYLERGSIRICDTSRTAVAAYRAATVNATAGPDLDEWTDRALSGSSRVIRFECLREDGSPSHTFAPREPILLRTIVRFDEPAMVDVALAIETDAEQPLFTTHLSDTKELRSFSGTVEFEARIDPNLLRKGRYLVSIAVGKSNWMSMLDVVYHFPAFEIDGHPTGGHFPLDNRWGPIYLRCDWTAK